MKPVKSRSESATNSVSELSHRAFKKSLHVIKANVTVLVASPLIVDGKASILA